MKNVYLSLVGGLLTLPLLAQQPLSQRQLPITRRSADNKTVVTETRSVGTALDALLKEPAAKAYHADLQALKAVLGGDAKIVRARLKPINDRLKGDRPRVQLGSFARGLDSVLAAQPVAAITQAATASTPEPVPASGVKPIPDQPADETERASADTSALSAPVSATGEAVEKTTSEGLNYWMLGAIAAALAALGLGALYAMARREIERLRRKETFGSNEQLMNALRKQVATQHEEIKQLRDENDALHRASSPPPPGRNVPRSGVEPLAAVLAPEPEPEPIPEPEPELEPAPIPPTALAPEQPVPVAPELPQRPSATFFLSTPNRDGSFSDVRRAEFIPSQSFYQFRLTNPEGTEAEFVFADDPASVRQALSSPDTYLQPACVYTDLRLEAQRIRTVHLGKARQTAPGERWEVVEKAEVTFG